MGGSEFLVRAAHSGRSIPLTILVLLVAAAALLGVAATARAADVAATDKSGPARFYVGTYTDHGSKGIYLIDLDPATGTLGEPRLVVETQSPSFLAFHPSHQFLYAVNEVSNFGGKKSGAVSAFAIDAASGKLTLLNQQPSGGDGPCHLAVDRTGKALFVANYGSGSVASFPLGADGKIGAAATVDQHAGKGPNPQRQEGPHAHNTDVDPANRFVLSADLGLDKIFVYRLDPATAKLTPNDPPAASVKPGSGPRHVAFGHAGRVYAINELASAVTLFRFDGEKGTLAEEQTVSTLPSDFRGENICAELIFHPSGQFLYASNRGHDSIAVFKADAGGGKLTPAALVPSGGKTPRGFNVDPSGRFLVVANQDSGTVGAFKINTTTGVPEPTGSVVKVASPAHVLFVP